MKKNIYLQLTTLLLLTLCVTVSATEFVLDNDTRNYDQQNIKLNLQFSFEDESVWGTADFSFIPLEANFDELILHSRITNIKSIKFGRKKLRFSQKNGLLHVFFPKKLPIGDTVEITVAYQTNPTTGLHFFYPTPDAPEIPYQIWSQGQGDNNRYWFPCFDLPGDKITAELTATVPQRFRVLSNGTLISETLNAKKGQKTVHWKMDYPQTPYLITLIVGEFTTVTDTVCGVPLNNHIPTYWKNAEVERIFGRTKDAMRFYCDYVAPYPYGKYDQTPVHDFKHGGMENASNSTLNSRIFHDSHSVPNYSPEMLIAHEMAHQWFGDLLTMADWRGIWLHESFAVYFTDMYFENFHGTDEFKKRRLDQNRKYFENARQNDPMEKVKFKGDLVPVDFGGYKCYNRGGGILHELRNELGDDLFQQGIRAYVKKYAFQTVTSQDFREVMENTTGHDLTQWFKQWIYGAGHPQFAVSYEWDETTKIMTLHVKQTQLETEVMGVFEVTVPVEIRAGKTRLQRRTPITKREETFTFRLPQAPDMVRFDVGNHVLKELTFHKSLGELKYQLYYDEDMIGRLLAAEQLAEYQENAVPVLKRAFKREDFYAVRQAIAKSLGQIASPAALEVLEIAAGDTDSRVRESVMDALANFDATAVRPVLVNALQTDYNDYVRGVAAHSLGIVKADSAFEILAAALTYPSSNQRIQIGIFDGFSELKDARALPLAKEYVKYKYSSGGAHKLEPVILNFANDMAADYRAEALEIMLEGIKNPFFRTNGKAAGMLQDLKAVETIPELKKALDTIQRPRGRRTIEGTIKKLQ